jgi:branched-chain amino acid transport system ATP-binding protein
MADGNHEEDEVAAEDIDWLVDEDGTEYFLEDGVRYELGDDGYAYPVEQAGESEPTAPAEPSPFSREAVSGRAADETTQIPTVTVTSGPEPAGQPAPAWPTADDGHARVLLELDDVRSGYGNLPVLHGVSTRIRYGETAVLLGLNGAGKTTTALNVCGALKTWDGTISFDGEDITGWGSKKAVHNGIVMVPEGRRVFPDLTVGKNLQIGAWSQRREGGWEEQQRQRVFDYFPRLSERVDQLAGTLSGGEQQMLAIARGLMANPKLLIIDEASMGLAPVIVHDVFEIIRHINEDGVTVLLIEQNVSALEVADLALVMEQGRMVKELRGEQLRDRNEVTEILMG